GLTRSALMSRTIPIIMFLLIATAGALAADSRVDNALFLAARKALPQDISTNETIRVLQSGLWNSNRTAVAVSFSRSTASVIFVFIRVLLHPIKTCSLSEPHRFCGLNFF